MLAPALRWPAPVADVRRLLRLIGPGVLGIGVVQINLLVSSWFATHLPAGTVAYLFYADRLVQLPLGIVGVRPGHGAAARPEHGRAPTARPAQGVLNRAVELALLLALPAAVGLVLLAQPIIHVLFERGAFGAEAALATGQVLAGLALGLPALCWRKVLAPGFYAREDTRTPVRVAAVALVVNVVAALAADPAARPCRASRWRCRCRAGLNALGLAWLLWRRGLLRARPGPGAGAARHPGPRSRSWPASLLAGRAGLAPEHVSAGPADRGRRRCLPARRLGAGALDLRRLGGLRRSRPRLTRPRAAVP